MGNAPPKAAATISPTDAFVGRDDALATFATVVEDMGADAGRWS
jgi:hypothetical protein